MSIFHRDVPISILDDIRKSADLQATTARETLSALREDLIETRERLRSAQDLEKLLRTQAAKDETTIRWMAARMNQVEAERALFLGKSSGTPVPIPGISIDPPQDTESTPRSPFDDQPNGYVPPEEEDMGLGAIKTFINNPPNPFEDRARGGVDFPTEDP